MRRHAVLGVAAAVLLLGGADARDISPGGYLTAQATPDGVTILPPPPKAGDARYVADRAIYAATRRLEGSPRWEMARRDVPSDPASVFAGFSCALGAKVSPEATPKLARMLVRLRVDSQRAVNTAKDIFKDPRPYLSEGGSICVPKTADLASSPNYPSGHQAYGWTVGLVLAELAPDRATPILARARAYGESRVVCGVHTASAIEASRTLAGALVAAEHTSPDFRDDLKAAREELAKARKKGGKPGGACATEAALTRTPW